MTVENLDSKLLREIADMDAEHTEGAVNIRKNGGLASRYSTANIQILSKEDKPLM